MLHAASLIIRRYQCRSPQEPAFNVTLCLHTVSSELGIPQKTTFALLLDSVELLINHHE